MEEMKRYSKSMKCAALFVVAAFSVSLVGCETYSFTNMAMKSPNTPGGSYDTVGSFSKTGMSTWMIFGLVPTGGAAGKDSPWTVEMVQPEIDAAGGNAAVNVSITRGSFFHPQSITAMIITYATFWFFSAKTYTISGDIIKYSDE